MVRSGVHHAFIYAVLFLFCCGYALIRGGAPERIGAAIYVAANILSILVVRDAGVRFHSPEIDLFIVDAAAYAAFALLALVANRYWPLWLTALQGTPVLFHAAVAASPAYVTPAYQISTVIWSYPIVLVLGLATYRHRARLRRGMPERSWRRSSATLISEQPFGQPTG